MTSHLDKIARGDTLRETGDLSGALASYQSARDDAPNDAQCLYKIGVALTALNRPAEAEAAYLEAITLRTDFFEAHNNLGILLANQGALELAERHYRSALEHRPDCVPAIINLGNLLAQTDRIDELLSLMFDAAATSARNFGDHLTFAGILCRWGCEYSGSALLASVLAHRISPPTNDELARAALLFSETGCFDGIRAIGNPFDIVERLPDERIRPFLIRLLTYSWNHDDNRRLNELYSRNNAAIERAAGCVDHRACSLDSLTDETLTIGFLGSLDRGNNTAKFLIAVLPHLRQHNFRLVYYSTIAPTPTDPIQIQLADLMDQIAWVQSLSPQEIARAVRDDKCAVLIDLDGFSRFSKTETFAHRAAPVQINWANWPSSLGLKSADYFLGSREMIPDDPALMVETPIALSTPFGAFTPFAEASLEVEPPNDTNGFVTFGNTSHPYKLSSRLVKLWADTMHCVPESRFRIARHECADDAFCEMMANEFRRFGIAPRRLEFFAFHTLGLNHLEAYRSIDICLDSAPYGGATTAADSLWMGVPMITLVGPGLHQRLSYSILSAVGVKELACESEGEFIDCAVRLANDKSRLQDYRRHLRTRFQASPLCDARAVANEVARALRFAVDDTKRRREL